jgi:hypothetical protein
MNNELNAVELSDLELDTVAGGFGGISIGDGQNLALDTNSSFSKNILQVAQATVSGPGGSGTQTAVGLDSLFTDAGQNLGVGN